MMLKVGVFFEDMEYMWHLSHHRLYVSFSLLCGEGHLYLELKVRFKATRPKLRIGIMGPLQGDTQLWHMLACGRK